MQKIYLNNVCKQGGISMKEYTGDRIRNVAIVGHGGAGTTSVTEGLLYRSGAITRMARLKMALPPLTMNRKKLNAAYP